MWPTILLFLITTPVARMSRLQFTVFPSITVLFAVIEHGPVYGVSTVPAGTPVLLPFGKPDCDVGEGVGLTGEGATGDGEVGVGVGATDGDGVGVGAGEPPPSPTVNVFLGLRLNHDPPLAKATQ
jgi:hypothetical protein